MKKDFIIAIRMTIATTVLLGLVYPLVVTSLAQTFFHDRANGQLLTRNVVTIGSRIIGQPFTGPGYFHSRPSASGDAGYDATASGGSNLGPTNQKLLDRVAADVVRLQQENPSTPIPADLVTASGSGLDPDISPAAAQFQIPRVARERHVSEDSIRALVRAHTLGPQFGVFGNSRVNVLELNLDLDTEAQHLPEK